MWFKLLNVLGQIGLKLAAFLVGLKVRFEQHRRPLADLTPLLKELERRELRQRLPDLTGQVCLILRGTASEPLFAGQSEVPRARLIVECLSSPSPPRRRGLCVVGAASSLPIRNGTIDFLIDTLDPASRQTAATRWPALLSSLKVGGRGILVILHPFGPLAPERKGDGIEGFEALYQLLRQSSCGLGNVREIAADPPLKKFFKNGEGSGWFERLKGKPLLLIFLVTRIK